MILYCFYSSLDLTFAKIRYNDQSTRTNTVSQRRNIKSSLLNFKRVLLLCEIYVLYLHSLYITIFDLRRITSILNSLKVKSNA